MKKIRTKIQYYGACEGNQEFEYLEHLKKLINDESKSYEINFNFDNGNGGDALVISKNAYEKVTFSRNAIKEDRVAAIFDHDFKENKFIEAVKYCEKKNVMSSYSNINFDLWLLLHKKYVKKSIFSTDGYVDEIIKVFNLPKGIDIKSSIAIKKILEQITLDDVKVAIERCKRIRKEQEESGTEIKKLPGHYEQPYVLLYEFVENILQMTGLL